MARQPGPSASSSVAGSSGARPDRRRSPGGWPTARSNSAMAASSSLSARARSAIGAGDAALGLGDVGAGQLGDAEPLLRAVQVALQPVEILLRIGAARCGPGRPRHRPRRRRAGHVLLGIRRAGPAPEQHLVLRPAGAGHRLAAAVERLLGRSRPIELVEDVGLAVVLALECRRQLRRGSARRPRSRRLSV